MATVAMVPADAQYIVGLASAFTIYQSYVAAQAAAIVLSAANSSAPAYVAKVKETVTSSGAVNLKSRSMPAGGPGYCVVQLASGTTYLPKNAAEVAAISLSASNAGATVLIAKAFQTCTGP